MAETTTVLNPAQQYVNTVLRRYVELPETPTRWHGYDRQVAQDLFRRHIPLDIIEAAFVLGSSRRLDHDPKALPLPLIRCLAYFLPVIEELLAEPMPRGYIQYLRWHLDKTQKRTAVNRPAQQQRTS